MSASRTGQLDDLEPEVLDGVDGRGICSYSPSGRRIDANVDEDAHADEG
jgi:hypothetical protein